jgi:hypothetical protein
MRTASRPTPLRRAVALLATALGLALAAAAAPWAAPAGAHEGDAVITIEAAHPAGTSVHYIVRVTWENDGHPAVDATVTATGVAADGTQLTPVTLTPADSDGRYAGIVAYPSAGAWTVRVTSVRPTGSVERAEQVTAPATTVPADDASDATTGSGGDDEGFAPADDGTGDTAGDAGDAGDETASADSGSDPGGMPIYLVVAAGVVVVIGALTALNVIRRNRGDLAGGAGTSAPPAGEPGAAADASDSAADARGRATDPSDPEPSAVAGRPAGESGGPDRRGDS